MILGKTTDSGKTGPWGVAAIVFVAAAAAAVGIEYDVTWHSIDTGGAMRTAGGAFEISGTIGQPDAGRLSGGAFEITRGFWFELAPGDCTEDGGVQLQDYTNFAGCLAGPDLDPGSDRCLCLDMDGDGDVDLGDMAEFQSLMTD